MKDFFQKYKFDNEIIAAGVSGGADSLALALRLKDCGKKVVALTVNHGLRSEAAEEAAYVAKVMAENGIEHHTLIWTGDKPVSGVEEAARQARYRLMFDFCRQNDIKVLATGHHRRDQAETFLLRLQRGSGVYGLSGILPVSERNGIMIIRPQLDKSPEELQRYLSERGIRWVNDPMNECTDFARVKMRKFLPQLQAIGIDEQRLAETAATLLNTRLFLQAQVDAFIAGKVRWWEDTAACLSWQKLKLLPQEISLPVLGQLVKKIGGFDYLPEASELKRVLAESDDFKGCTLGNCELFIAVKRLWIVPQDKENRLMTRAEWEAVLKEYPFYRNAGLPYKVRRALKDKLENRNG